MRLTGLKPSVVPYTIAISVCGDWRRVLELLKMVQAEGIEPDAVMYSTAVNVCAKQGRWELVLALLSVMTDAGLTPSMASYTAAVNACGRSSQWARALGLVAGLEERGLRPDRILYNSTISACERGGEWRWALRSLEDMRRAACRPDSISYSSAVIACGRGLQWEAALGLFTGMAAAALKRDTRSYNSAVLVCEEGSHWQRAVHLLDELGRTGHRPDVVSYNLTINACGKLAQWAKALALFGAMEEEGVTANIISYGSVISACEKGAQWERASGLFAAMQHAGVEPDLVAYCALISACEKAGRWQEALHLLHHLEANGPAPNVVAYDAAILALSNAGAWEECIALLEHKAARGFKQGRHILGAMLRVLAVPGVPLERAVEALLFFEAGVEDVTQLDIEDAARRLEGALDGTSFTVAGDDARCVPAPLAQGRRSLEAETLLLAEELEAQAAYMEAQAPAVLHDLGVLLKPRHPSARLKPYGSIVEGTSGSGGDIDVTAVLDLAGSGSGAPTQSKHFAQVLALRDIQAAVQTSPAWSVRGAAFAAKVPVLSLRHRPSGCELDLTVNNSACVWQSAALGKLITTQTRHLVRAVKLWARRRQVYGKARGRLGGFAFAQLAVFFSHVGPPAPTLSQLLAGFFDFYANRFDWAQECVSVAAGRRVLKASPRARGSAHLSIEDCFERSTDLCTPSLAAAESSRLRAEFCRVADLLESPQTSLETILEEPPDASGKYTQAPS